MVLGLALEKILHAGFKLIWEDKVYYIDPFQLTDPEPADVIFITHDHFDHCSQKDLELIIKEGTVIVASESCKEMLTNIKAEIHYVKPGEEGEAGIPYRTIPAYNIDKKKETGELFHPQEAQGVGFILTVGDKTLLHAGDTDPTEELKSQKVDIALLPASGTYVMTPEEAADVANIIKPQVAVPMHYGVIVGSLKDGERFKERVDGAVELLD